MGWVIFVTLDGATLPMAMDRIPCKDELVTINGSEFRVSEVYTVMAVSANTIQKCTHRVILK